MSRFRLDGKRVLITGASRGIGAELARLLGDRVRELVLVARTREDPDQLAGELAVPTRVIVADLAAPGGVDDVIEAISDVEIDVLIDNAGIGLAGSFQEADRERICTLLELNVVSLVRLTHALLPGMQARGQGGVLNVGSTVGFQGVPFMATYSASKALVNHFTEALSGEVAGTGVVVAGLCPGTTRTAFFDAAGIDRGALMGGSQDARTVARAGLRALERGRVLHVPGILNGFLIHGQRLVPRRLVRWITRWMFRPLE